MKIVKCPQCKTEAPFSEENQYRPFCSKRCKLIDLGEWADEKYKVPESQSSISELDIDEEQDKTLH